MGVNVLILVPLPNHVAWAWLFTVSPSRVGVVPLQKLLSSRRDELR